MPDDKNLRGGRDRDRINPNEEYEVRHVAEKFNVSAEEVKKAIQRVGNEREKVEEALRSNPA